MLKFIINLKDNLKREVPIKEGLVIGRSKGDIVIEDPQISSTHAIIKSNKEGIFYLKDMSSTNGILVGGERVKEAFLVPGVKIQIGNTILNIKEMLSEDVKTQKDATSLSSYIERLDFIDNSTNSEIIPFHSPVEIHFVRGVLNKTVWMLYWGPVVIGTKPGSYSIIDTEVNAGLDIFELSQTTNEKAIFLKNLGAVQLKVNGAPLTKSGLIENGDLIEFSETAFRIKL